MIGSSCLGTSSWNSDPLLGRSFDILDFDQLESNFSVFDRKDESSCSASPVHSSSSDDCDLTFGDMTSMLPVVDTLACELLEEESIVDSLDLSDLDWVSLSDTLQDETVVAQNICNSNVDDAPRKKKRCTKSSKSLSSSKSWSRMTTEERLRTAHALSDIISQRMNLSHQIEVIKLIDPTAVLSPNTTEFTINLSYLNDTKLKRIKEYVKKHAVLMSDSDSLVTKSDSKSCSSNSGKRRQRKYKPQCTDEWKLRERKVIQQDRKEKRSGLFVMEKIVKKLSNPSEEDEDVNILE